MVQTYRTFTIVKLISPNLITDSIEQYMYFPKRKPSVLLLHTHSQSAFLLRFNFIRVLKENGEENSYPGDSLSPTGSHKPNAAILQAPSFKGS